MVRSDFILILQMQQRKQEMTSIGIQLPWCAHIRVWFVAVIKFIIATNCVAKHLDTLSATAGYHGPLHLTLQRLSKSWDKSCGDELSYAHLQSRLELFHFTLQIFYCLIAFPGMLVDVRCCGGIVLSENVLSIGVLVQPVHLKWSMYAGLVHYTVLYCHGLQKLQCKIC